eukprot:jgi/Botrbrau1/18648/Bobra.0367s0084.1
MVKEDSFSADIAVPLQDFCSLFEDPGTFTKYHNSVNGNPHVKIAEWENGIRRVAFLCPYDAPTWLKRAIGTDVVKIRDYQELQKNFDPETSELTSLVMVSNPRLFIPGRKEDLQIATTLFTATRATLSDGRAGVKMAASVRCSAEELKYLWAFQGAIENVMMHKCKYIATSFLEFCTEQLQASSRPPLALRTELRRMATASDSAASLGNVVEAAGQARQDCYPPSEAVLSSGAVRPIIAAGPASPPGGCTADSVEVRLWMEDAAEAGAWYDASSGSDSDPPPSPPQPADSDQTRLRDVHKAVRQTVALIKSLNERQRAMEEELTKLQRWVAPRGLVGRARGPQVWLAEANPFLLTGALAAALGVSFAGGWVLASRRHRRSWH